MKRFLLLYLVICFALLSIPINVNATSSDIKIIINGDVQQFEVSALNINGTVLVPMRAIFEKLNASVSWNGGNKQITATKDFSKIVLTINSKSAIINNQEIEMSVAPQIVKGNTMVPLRIVGEALDADVKWAQDENAVKIALNSKWEQIKPIVGSSVNYDWSPDDLLTIATDKGVQQYKSGKWEQFDENNSPLINNKVDRVKWSQDGKLVTTSTFELESANSVKYVWVFEKGNWNKIYLPKRSGEFSGYSVNTDVSINNIDYLGWSPDNILTATFGVSYYLGISYSGIWQYIDGKWSQLINSDKMESISDLIYSNGTWYVLAQENYENITWIYNNGKARKLNQSGFIPDSIFKIGNIIYSGGFKGVYKLIEDNWVQVNEQTFSELKDLQLSNESVSFTENTTVLSGLSKNSLWMRIDGFWNKLDDNALPFFTEPSNVEIQESWKEKIEKGMESNIKTTTCSDGKCVTKDDKVIYKISTKFSKESFIKSIKLSQSGKKIYVVTYKFNQLYFTYPSLKGDEENVISIKEAPPQFWIYNAE